MAVHSCAKPFASCRGGARAVSLLVVFLLLSRAASAQSSDRPEDQAAARALFQEARALAKAKDYAAACPKFEASNRLYVSPGTLLNLADCHEQLGRTASAWTRFGEAASVAARAGRAETAQEARRRQRAVEPRLMRVLIRVSAPVPNLVVERDGVPISEAAWGSSLPVDPGKHTLTASAPNHEAWSTAFELSRPGKTLTVEVPALHAAPEPSPAQAAAPGGSGEAPGEGVSPASDAAPRPSHTVQWVLIGGGGALALGGAALMLVQHNRANTSRDENDTDLYDSTKTPWAIGLTGVIAGAATAAAGAAWMFTLASDESQAVGAAPWFSADAAGLNVRGAW